MEILTMIFALIDDTSADRQKLYSILTEYAAHHSDELILRCFSSGEEFLKNFHPCQYAAVFLDIYMKKLKLNMYANHVDMKLANG